VRPREKQIITKLLKITNYTVTKMKGGKIVKNDITWLITCSSYILPKVLLVRNIPTPRILLFIFSVNFEVEQTVTDPFRGSLLNSTMSLNDCDGKGGVGLIS
jgi:hypothetical protein